MSSTEEVAPEIEYDEPKEQTFYMTVTALRGRTFEPVEFCSAGIQVRGEGRREKAHVARWSAVIKAMRKAFELSPKMRQDVRAMLDEIEGGSGVH